MGKAVLPDYRNCGLNVASAVLHHFGVPCAHAQHEVVKALLDEKQYKNVVVMLFDGMGEATLKEMLPQDAFLRTHRAQPMTAVFPSTTVAATTSIESGDAPCEHGWLGWSMYFYQIDRIIDVFLSRDSRTGEWLGKGREVAARYLPYRDICEKLNETGAVRAHIVSQFGNERIETLDELFDRAQALCRAEGRQYIYTYWSEPDHTMHEKGVMAVKDIVCDINRRVERFCQQADEDTLVLVTADHGLLDCQTVYVEDHKELRDMCLRPTSMEPRATVFYVKPECMEEFPEAFARAFGTEHFWLLKSDEALNMRLFGEGEEHPQLRDFLGDYLAIATDSLSIGWQKEAYTLLGMHAGMTEREMFVPLIVGYR